MAWLTVVGYLLFGFEMYCELAGENPTSNLCVFARENVFELFEVSEVMRSLRPEVSHKEQFSYLAKFVLNVISV